MIKNKEKKITKICNAIQSRMSEFNDPKRIDPGFYFYRRVLRLRKESQNIEVFLNSDSNIEILYATLVAWNMNCRGAKLKYFDDFKKNILSCKNYFQELEEITNANTVDYEKIMDLLVTIYRRLNLMKGKSKLVSNSKLLHFLFPTICMPMDREKTLNYFYGNTSESENKYIEITSLSFEIMKDHLHFKNFLDNRWNTTIPKLIDNAIILIQESTSDH
jgi:hypothetical protein